MNANNFTEMLVTAFNEANQYCQANQLAELSPVVMTKALIDQNQGLVAPIISKLGQPGQQFINDIEEAVEKSPRVSGATSVYMAPSINEALSKAENYKIILKMNFFLLILFS
jgi:ATP-dependent Clp protease ATP-binding subunit ClpB